MDQQPTTNAYASAKEQPQQSQHQQQQQQAKPLSCTNCRARKLKCSREYPCPHCVRSGAECIFPTRKRIRKPRRNKNSELLQRLSRLETIVGNVGLSGLIGEDDSSSALGPSTAPGAPGPVIHPALDGALKQAPAPGGERQDVPGGALPESKASRYLGGEFWTSLSVEVEGLRQALEQSTDSDSDEPSQEASPESAANVTSPSTVSAASPGMLLGGTPRGAGYEHFEHPTSDQIRFLSSTFFTNVDMILKILHRPTVQAALEALASGPDSTRSQLPPGREALFFSVYHAAVASLSASDCLTHLGRRREDLLRTYAAAVEHMLFRADYLNNTTIEILQALTLYVACVRTSNGSRASWALISLPVRLAHGLNLHREGSNAHLSPYETELRRRLWWQLLVLDIRASEDRGTTTIVARDSYDTRLPLNINDEDFGPDSPGPLVEKEGPTDVTFSLCTAQASNIFLYVEHAQGTLGTDDSNDGGDPSQTVDQIVRYAQSLESQFVAGADPNHAPSYFASMMAHLITLKMWLSMQYPVHPRQRNAVRSACLQEARPGPGSGTSAAAAGGNGNGIFPPDATLRTALSIVELNEHLSTGPYGERFRWWADTYVQWHPLAVAMAELCTQTRGELVDRAWRTIDDIFPRWSEVIADTKSGTLWRPIRKLYKKAKAARAVTTTAAATAPPLPTTSTSSLNPTTITNSTPTIPIISTPILDIPPPTNTITNTTNRPPTTRVTQHILTKEGVDFGTIDMRTNIGHIESTISPNPTMQPELEPESTFGTEIIHHQQTPEPDIPADLDKLSMSPYGLTESMWGWRDLSLDAIPFMGLHDGNNSAMDWTAWDDFVNETQAEPDPRSKLLSSEMEM
ncbi:hypothetical protein M426DRAFT_322224 [Hypoxylon sp. CI-4A]|nr:hypothetical protein M426DRAFT_322224 [Hypoxylon sp. CI-4A]